MIFIHLIFNHKNYFQKGQNSRKQAKNKTQKNQKPNQTKNYACENNEEYSVKILKNT